MRLLAKCVALSENDVASAREGGDVLGLGDAGAAHMKMLGRSLTRRLSSTKVTSAASGLNVLRLTSPGVLGVPRAKVKQPEGAESRPATYTSTTAESAVSVASVASSSDADKDAPGDSRV